MYYLSFRKQKFNTSSLSLDMKMVNTIHLVQDNYLWDNIPLQKYWLKYWYLAILEALNYESLGASFQT